MQNTMGPTMTRAALIAACCASCTLTGETVVEPPQSSGGSQPFHLRLPRPEPNTSIDPREALPLCESVSRSVTEQLARERAAALDGGGPTPEAPPPDGVLLSPASIRQVVLRELGSVSECYENSQLGEEPHVGRTVIRFVIGPTGAVLAAGVQSSSINNRYQRQCLVNAVRHWQFPPPASRGVVTVSYPFTLGAQPDNASAPAVSEGVR